MRIPINGGLREGWIAPVFDRTEEDVAFAKEQIQAWITAQLTGNPVETYELKGCLNLTDINRIEWNIRYLSDRLEELHYPTGTDCKTWMQSDMPTERDIRRILSNVNLLISAYYQQDGVSIVPESMKTYSDINAIEENLYCIKRLVDGMVGSFSKSGTFQSGARRMLPIGR